MIRWERNESEKKMRKDDNLKHRLNSMWKLREEIFLLSSSKLEWNDLNSFFFSLLNLIPFLAEFFFLLSRRNKVMKIWRKGRLKNWVWTMWWARVKMMSLEWKVCNINSEKKIFKIYMFYCAQLKRMEMWYFHLLHTIKDQHSAVNIYVDNLIAIHGFVNHRLNSTRLQENVDHLISALRISLKTHLLLLPDYEIRSFEMENTISKIFQLWDWLVPVKNLVD